MTVKIEVIFEETIQPDGTSDMDISFNYVEDESSSEDEKILAKVLPKNFALLLKRNMANRNIGADEAIFSYEKS